MTPTWVSWCSANTRMLLTSNAESTKPSDFRWIAARAECCRQRQILNSFVWARTVPSIEGPFNWISRLNTGTSIHFLRHISSQKLNLKNFSRGNLVAEKSMDLKLCECTGRDRTYEEEKAGIFHPINQWGPRSTTINQARWISFRHLIFYLLEWIFFFNRINFMLLLSCPPPTNWLNKSWRVDAHPDLFKSWNLCTSFGCRWSFHRWWSSTKWVCVL